MTRTDAKKLTRDVFERGFGHGELDAVDCALDPAAVDRHPFGPDEPDMAHHLKGAIMMIRSAFPDLTVEVGHLIQDGNTLAARVQMSGHHTGAPIFGIPAAGAVVDIEQFHVIEVNDDGRGIRHWANVGIEQMQTQLRAGVSTRVGEG
jgi:predicted ester cyclase